MLDDVRNFWNSFALEYYENQLASKTPIAQSVLDYLLKEKIFPTNRFLDLAGGSGRYLEKFEPYCHFYDLVDISANMLAYAKKIKKSNNTQLILTSQEDFFFNNSQSYDIVFSAMNPALNTFASFKQFQDIKAKNHLLLRLEYSKDSLFSPYEYEESDALLPIYIKWLKELKIPFVEKTFSFAYEEEIARSFFQEYFNDSSLTERIFANDISKINKIKTQYKLLQF